MALADFLGKSALSASQILSNFNFDAFQQLLLSHRIAIYIDRESMHHPEGYACADLVTRLVARLYPSLQISCLDGESEAVELLEALARSINPKIDIRFSESPTAAIIIGSTPVHGDFPTIYAGSETWLAKISTSRPVGSGSSILRCGAGAAACIATANLFRYVFRDQLPDPVLDGDLVFSTYNFSMGEQALQGPAMDRIEIEETALVGLGAIGNAVCWALKDLPIKGKLHLVDGEAIDLSNLQRYVLATTDDETQKKVSVCARYLRCENFLEYDLHYDAYLGARGNYLIPRVAVCVDSAKDRRSVQGSLPKKIINAWTQPEQCGLSRHYDFLNDPCLVCLYLPERTEKPLPVLIAESFGFTDKADIRMVREYMGTGKPVDEQLVNLIGERRRVNPRELLEFCGSPVETFYHDVICGGVMMELTGQGNREQAAEVPSAFESALAGIILAAEMIIDSGNIRTEKIPTITQVNLIRPLTKYTTNKVPKANKPHCICHDPVYREVYGDKWIPTNNNC